jgi:peptidyl-prolyl cis-trans isomerase D
MAILETIRVKFGILISVLIAVALLSFIVDFGTIQSLSSTSSKYDVGEIGGKSISYTDFQAEIEKITAISEMNGNPVQGDEALAMVRQQAWQQFLTDYLFIPSAKAAGFNVGEEEMYQLVSGEMISGFLMQMFQGQLNKELLMDIEAQVEADETGRMRLFWDNLLETVYADQFYSKYQSLFVKSSFNNALALAEQIKDNNNTFDVEFVVVPFGFGIDTTIVVSDKEIKDYYNSHKDQFKQVASRDIEYIVVDIVPSADDVTAANNAIAAVYEDFKTAENVRNFLLSKSDRQFDRKWYKAGELKAVSADVDAFVAEARVGDVSPIFQNGNSFYAVKVMESAQVPEQVQVKYTQAGAEGAAEALAAAQPQWVSQMEGFEDLMTTAVGQQITINGMLFEVVATQDPVAKKRVAILEKTAQPSDATRSACYAKANSVASKAGGKLEGFRKAVEEDGLYAHPYNRMPEGTDRLGSVEHTKEVTRWAFEAKAGEVSSIISIDNKYYVVAALKGIHKEGFTPLEEVASRIKPVLYQEKAAAKKTAEVAEKINGLTDLAAVAEALGTTVSSKEGVTFASFTSAGLDNKFIGAASVAEVGALNGPLQGNTGVYVYTVTGRSEGAFFTEDDAANREQQMSYTATQMLLPVMMNEADVKDNTARFY